MAEHAGVLLSHHVHMALQNDFILGQRAGLVGAENVHRPQVLNGLKVLDDNVFPGHGHCALRKAGRDQLGSIAGVKPRLRKPQRAASSQLAFVMRFSAARRRLDQPKTFSTRKRN
jgi:hypothetical protein